ncbi:hypothetical protein [Nesterenkonia ebinurensis]|uniref:hypothetical protein n=1 Tax=Nesterenkonia ebinurensis TaxID=2608252 RepID=UPI00123D270B|nr:hypothetical protein [Nesterenkonia ebinurensis]
MISQSLRIARRRVATVAVEGLDGLGIQLAELLAQLSIGTLILRDSRPVLPVDPEFRTIDLGRPRAEAVTERLSSQAAETAVIEAFEDSALAGADLHLVTGIEELQAEALRRAWRESSAVLPVLASAQGWWAGPLLMPGSPLCPECLVQQGLLSAAAQNQPGAERANPSAPDPDPQVVLGAAAAAALQAAVLIDGHPHCAVQESALVCQAETGLITPQPVQPAQDCACFTTAVPVGL